MTNDELKALCERIFSEDCPRANSILVEDLAAQCLRLLAQCEAMRGVVSAAEAHAKATIEYRLGKITERDIAGYYNRLVELASQLGERT